MAETDWQSIWRLRAFLRFEQAADLLVGFNPDFPPTISEGIMSRAKSIHGTLIDAALAGALVGWVRGSPKPDIAPPQLPEGYLVTASLRDWCRTNSVDLGTLALPGTDPHAVLDVNQAQHSALLAIAIRAWEAIAKTGPKPKKTVKATITAWLGQHYDWLSKNETDAIAMIANWEKTGGAPPINRQTAKNRKDRANKSR